MHGKRQALINATDHEIYESLTSSSSGKNGDEKGVVGTEIIRERAHIILNELRELSLFTREECLEHIGNLYSCINVHTFFLVIKILIFDI